MIGDVTRTPVPGRPEAIRRLVEVAFKAKVRRSGD